MDQRPRQRPLLPKDKRPEETSAPWASLDQPRDTGDRRVTEQGHMTAQQHLELLKQALTEARSKYIERYLEYIHAEADFMRAPRSIQPSGLHDNVWDHPSFHIEETISPYHDRRRIAPCSARHEFVSGNDEQDPNSPQQTSPCLNYGTTIPSASSLVDPFLPLSPERDDDESNTDGCASEHDEADTMESAKREKRRKRMAKKTPRSHRFEGI